MMISRYCPTTAFSRFILLLPLTFGQLQQAVAQTTLEIAPSTDETTNADPALSNTEVTDTTPLPNRDSSLTTRTSESPKPRELKVNAAQSFDTLPIPEELKKFRPRFVEVDPVAE